MEQTRRHFLYGVVLCLLSGALRMAEPYVPEPWDGLPVFIETFIYLGLILAWGISVHRRLLPSVSRNCLMGAVALMALWMMLRLYRYNLTGGLVQASLLAWYAYYIPANFQSMLFLLSALDRQGASRSPIRHLLWIPTSLLSLVALTNSWHWQMFRLDPATFLQTGAYSWGPMYYVTVVWIALCLIGGVGVMARASWQRRDQRIRLGALGLSAAVFLYILAPVALPFLIYVRLPYTFADATCFGMILLWESCMQIGIFPTNQDYQLFFDHSRLSARVTDRALSTVYASEDALPVTEVQMESALERPLRLDAETLLLGQPIQGGYTFWTEHTTEVDRLNDALISASESLSEENELLAAENEVHETRARLREQNRIYDGIAAATQPQMDKVERLTASMRPEDPDFSRRMARACVLYAYMKRLTNLRLLAASSGTLDVQELRLSLKESLNYLALNGTVCDLSGRAEGRFPGAWILALYAAFETLAEGWEEAPPSLLLVLEGTEKTGLTLRMETQAGEDLPWKEALLRETRAAGAACERATEDDTEYWTLAFAAEEGDA